MEQNVRVTGVFLPFPLVSKAAKGSVLLGENGSIPPPKTRSDPDPASLPPKTGAGVIHHTGLDEEGSFAFTFANGKTEVEADGEAEKAELLVPANAANPPVLATFLNGGEEGVAKAGVWVGVGSRADLETGAGAGVDSLIGAGGTASRSSCVFVIVCRSVYSCPSRMFSSERLIDSRQFLRHLAEAGIIQVPGEIVTEAIGG